MHFVARGLLVTALAGAAPAMAGCATARVPSDEISRMAEATVILQLDDQTKRDVVETYRAWVDDVPAAEAEKVLDAFVAYGLVEGEVREAFALAVEGMAGSVSADGVLRILDRAVLSGRVEAPDLMQLLRAVRDCAKAKVPEKIMVKGVHALAVWRFRPSDMAAYLRGLPVAMAGPHRGSVTDVVLIYHFMRKLRLPPKYRVQIYEQGIQAVSRGMPVKDYGLFFQFLLAGRVPNSEVAQYCGFLARHANEQVLLHTIAPGYDGVEDLPLSAERRLALFEGVVAAAAAGADPDDVSDALVALRRKAHKLEKQALGGIAELILRTFAGYDSGMVLEAVERALTGEIGTGEELAERLSLELSRVAASRRAG